MPARYKTAFISRITCETAETLPVFPFFFSSSFSLLPQEDWKEFRLLTLMIWNSWNPGFRHCAHF